MQSLMFMFGSNFYMCCPGFPFFFQYSSEIPITWYDEGILISVNIICKGILERIIMTVSRVCIV